MTAQKHDTGKSTLLAKIGFVDYSGKSDDEISKELAEALYSKDLKKLCSLNDELAIRYLSKTTDLDEIKCFLEKRILEHEKRPADFQNAINFYAKSIIKSRKNRQQMTTYFFSFLLEVSGKSLLYEKLYSKKDSMSEIRNFFKI